MFLLVMVTLITGLSIITFYAWRGGNTGIPEEIDAVREFSQAKETDYKSHFAGLFNGLRPGKEKISDHLQRDIFQQYREEKKIVYPMKIKEIVFNPQSFMYMGNIEKSPGEFIAQINWKDSTSFVREGDRLDEWTVVQIRKAEVKLINAKGRELLLPTRMRVRAYEPHVVLISNKTGKEYLLHQGDMAEGYKILDISQSMVILKSQIETFTLKK